MSVLDVLKDVLDEYSGKDVLVDWLVGGWVGWLIDPYRCSKQYGLYALLAVQSLGFHL